MDNRSIIQRWLCDSAIAFLLIVAGIFASRPLAECFHARGVGYLGCFVIAEIPFIFFLGVRRGFFRWWEYLGFFACLIAMTVARDRLAQLGLDNLLVLAVIQGIIFGCFLCFHQAVRSQQMARPSNDGLRSE